MASKSITDVSTINSLNDNDLLFVNSSNSVKQITKANSGMVTITLLWENASPTSSMAAQTLTVANMGNYEQLLLIAKDYNTANDYQSLIIPNKIGIGGQFVYIGTACDYKYWRAVSISASNQITIAEGKKGTAIDNIECIPYRIYGIKGVK